MINSDDEAVQPPRDETKRKAAAKKEFKKIIHGGVDLLNFLIEHPKAWTDPDMKEFREKAYMVTSDVKNYPPCDQGKEEYDTSKLTKDIASLLFSSEQC